MLGLFTACSETTEIETGGSGYTYPRKDEEPKTTEPDTTEPEPATEKEKQVVSTSELYNTLLETWPQIERWPLVDEKGSKMYTDTGSYSAFNSVIMISDTSVTFSMYKGKIQIYYWTESTNNRIEIIVRVADSEIPIEQSIRLGTSILKYRTDALSVSTLLSRLNNSSVKNGNHYYQETVDGIRYFLTSAVDGQGDIVMISFE
ncbi:MAG: hypothetical protein IK082_11055 [Oscillospiraceae bacterium]|nr:hypothetical protein [Oscillospiraceae bacterium]